MKKQFLSLVPLVLVAVLAAADQANPPQSPPVAKAAAASVRNGAWLGVKISRPGAEVRAHLPGLPKGTGFVIERAEAQGPAKAAGLLANDVIWKLDGQLLVNEAQLAVLLGQHRPGDEVEIDYYRFGKQASTKLILGEAPLGVGFDVKRGLPPLVTAQALPGMPTRIVNVPSRTASIDNEDGRAVLTMDRTGIHLVISDDQGRTSHEGPLFDVKGRITVPVEWRERVESLHAALIESIQRAQPPRRPRLRVIPRPENKDR